MSSHDSHVSRTVAAPGLSFLERHEFLLRRLHSLTGLIPVGAYMCVHLVTNASVLESPATFQKNVYTIHSLGRLLPFVEWTFIFIPILFHAIFGIIIIRSGLPNHSVYTRGSNVRYTMQRVTGMIAFVFIMWHVFHMHGWFHNAAWLGFAERLGGAQFKAYNAATSAAAALQSWVVAGLYAVGILSCVFHLANGIWTMGITWGIWISAQAQQRALYICAAFGIALAAVGLGALQGMRSIDMEKARASEDQQYEARMQAGDIQANEHKRAAGVDHTSMEPSEGATSHKDPQGDPETVPGNS
jgi:succinate dehydrogenase / fumarate reductase, cytochrome b subunit